MTNTVTPAVAPLASASRPAAPIPDRAPAPPVFAADVGGTWVRMRTGGPEEPVERVPSPSRLRHPERSVPRLRAELVGLLCDRVPAGARAALSFGAAVDHLTGTVYGSAPLWGEERAPYDVAAELRRRRPDVTWHLVNDVTAALLDFAAVHAPPGVRRVAYLTVSSGIALRTADLEQRRIPVDDRGLQGEVGHLPVAFTAPGSDVLTGLPCECGARDHLASVASGPGLARTAERLGLARPAQVADWLPGALAADDPGARRLLELCAAPVAGLLRTMWCLDPHLDLIGIGGGVAEGLAGPYAAEIRRLLAAPTSYADRGRDDAWLDERLVFCAPGQVDPLRGAQRVADWRPGITR
ncbi:putative NBD/HSP70 family sugar kinase [Streptomyces sp. SAI-133]|uniref:ROK family protein n=1 Tax=unclassified Streptomyces TaxID=2593676 RepID=UPI002476729C|nr:ROK family protein [Streptomyces sp. SAI-133]MDH6588038.1 putative NBD/HSP70 family sugar kinase [Streptomyces sp. SAI-133]